MSRLRDEKRDGGLSPDDLARLLLRLARDLDALAQPWIVFGGAALVIRGLPEPGIPDLDILTSGGDAGRLEAA